jgi:hypothetical protein
MALAKATPIQKLVSILANLNRYAKPAAHKAISYLAPSLDAL